MNREQQPWTCETAGLHGGAHCARSCLISTCMAFWSAAMLLTLLTCILRAEVVADLLAPLSELALPAMAWTCAPTHSLAGHS